MFLKFSKIILFFLVGVGIVLVCLFFIYPKLFINIYRGNDQQTIWVESKYFSVKKIISDTNFFKAPNTQWSPNGNFFSFFDFVRLEWTTKEWALKIVDARTFKIKTIFVGDYKISEYKWLDNRTVRVYESMGSGVRAFRDIEINISQPIVAVDDYEIGDWIPEKTF